MMRFWMKFTYQCDGCGHELRFLLEDGCEGPRDGEPLIARLPDHHPAGGELRPWPRTASGRLVIPVPFVAGPCPKCNPNGERLLSAGGWLSHARWNEDERLDPMVETDGPPESPYFAYEEGSSPENTQPCGRPMYARAGV